MKGLAVGIGLTNDCNLHCAHCYRDQDRISNLTLSDIKKVCTSLRIGSIALGTGENGLNPHYLEILKYLGTLQIRLTVASNGYTVSRTPDEMMRYFSDVEFSIDFPDQERQDHFRGKENWRTIMNEIERCGRLGINVSILAVLMNLNYRDLGHLARLAASLGANLRVNVYQPVFKDQFMVSFDQYWEAFQILFDHSKIISVTEPLVNTFLGLNHLTGTPCGAKSLRITPDRRLKTCVYWPIADLTIDDLVEKAEGIFTTPLFEGMKKIPPFCQGCDHADNCGGGCATRRKLREGFNEPDEYCPVVRRKTILLRGQLSSAEEPLRTGSICTTIVRGV